MGNCMSSEPIPAHQSTGRTTAPRNTVPQKKPTTPAATTTKKKTTPPKVDKKKGYKLSDTPTTSEEKLTPAEAARRAAEEREQKKKETQGKLGKQLDEHRQKSGKTLVLEDLAKKEKEKNNVHGLHYD